LSAFESAAIVRTEIESTNRREYEQAEALLADDFQLVDEATGEIFYGVDGFRRFTRDFLIAFPDNQVEILNMVAGENEVAIEQVFHGTNTGPFITPAADLPPTGYTVHHRGTAIFTLRDGKIRSHRLYYDAISLMQQLGLIPDPEALGA
jgi:steroid delta-isomerase-like uncharacterized protein